VRLQDDLQIFTQPLDALITTWYQNNVAELKFNQPQWGVYGTKTFSTGQAGDFVVLQKNNCNNVNLRTPSVYTIGKTDQSISGYSSALMMLEEYSVRGNPASMPPALGGDLRDIMAIGDEKGGVATVISLANGKVNELQPGFYKICYATGPSGGDDVEDFMPLRNDFEILPISSNRPDVQVSRTVLLGQDIIVRWNSAVQGLDTVLQPKSSWIGLYRNGTCPPEAYGAEWQEQKNQVYRREIDNTGLKAPISETFPGYIEKTQNECYLAYQFVESGVSSGVVRFSQRDYSYGGTYDVRFFQGNSRNEQGRVCRGLGNAPHETYVTCWLEAAYVSGPIEVIPDRARLDNMDDMPGMEVMFTGSRGRYND